MGKPTTYDNNKGKGDGGAGNSSLFTYAWLINPLNEKAGFQQSKQKLPCMVDNRFLVNRICDKYLF